MIPMISVPWEMDDIRALIEKERDIALKRGVAPPSKLSIGAMIEVPSVLFELDALLPKVDFVSVAVTTSPSSCSRPIAAMGAWAAVRHAQRRHAAGPQDAVEGTRKQWGAVNPMWRNGGVARSRP